MKEPASEKYKWRSSTFRFWKRFFIGWFIGVSMVCYYEFICAVRNDDIIAAMVIVFGMFSSVGFLVWIVGNIDRIRIEQGER